jgi:hypothetical protein
MELFGFEISRKKEQQEQERKQSFVAPDTDDGATVVSEGGYYGQYVDIEGVKAKDDADLIKKYREISLYPECDAAITDIINESIVADDDVQPVDIITDDIKYPDKIKKLIKQEFDNTIKLLHFNAQAHDIFRKWYVDGRLYYHMVIDEKDPKAGILELRPIDAIKIRKVRSIIEDKDPKTGAKLIKGYNEFYVYNDSLMGNVNNPGGMGGGLRNSTGLKISKDSIIYVPSGLVETTSKKMLSNLYKALKPVNQLRMMEDSLVIYRMARAPERRIFYIDVGNLPKGKAEAYLRDIMARYKNKIVYDASTGEIRDDRKHMAMLEDFWLPRREGGKGTEISTLPGGENLGQIEDIIYFQKKLYRSLNVPMSRMETDTGFSLGRSNEISRDELKFNKFVSRLRKKFADLFLQVLKTQLILKGVINKEDWESIKEDLIIDFKKDNYFAELKDSEIVRERMQTLQLMDPYVGKYFSQLWVRKNILKQTDMEIEEMDKEMEDEPPSLEQMQVQAQQQQMMAPQGPTSDNPENPLQAGGDQVTNA